MDLHKTLSIQVLLITPEKRALLLPVAISRVAKPVSRQL
jgi:hypothetical protein